jgi:H+/Cl- antiporter ClcA
MAEGDSSNGDQLNDSRGFRLLPISIIAAVLGAATGGIAYLLYGFIAVCTSIVFYHNINFKLQSPLHHQLGVFVILMPIIGGLIVGIMARFGSRKICGHGIPEAMEAVLVNQSRIAPKVAVLKPLSAGIAIGTGGPFGAEGPIIQTGGAIGSLVGQFLHTTATERKVLLSCGAAAGMAATFGSPIAAVILAFELLLFEFKPRSFIPLVIATTLATNVHDMLMGPGPMFHIGQLDFGLPGALPFYAILGLISGYAAVGFTRVLYWFEDMFEKLPINFMWWPAIGGLGLGIIGYFQPRVFGVGYDTISDILNGKLTAAVLISIVVYKTIALVISIGSGTSGGLLAPSFMVSAAMGATFASLVNYLIPGMHLSPAAFALAGMGAMFGAASRATFAFIVFALEITRDFDAVLPVMLVAVIASGVALRYLRHTVMTEKLARRGLRIHQEYEPDVLMDVSVSDVMDSDLQTVKADMLVEDLAERLRKHDSAYTRHAALPILANNGDLVGIVTRGDVLRAVSEGGEKKTVIEAGSRSPLVAYREESLHDATVRMLRHNIGRLPVVSQAKPGVVIGYLGREEVLSARVRRITAEYVRDPGWMSSFSNSSASTSPDSSCATTTTSV